MINLKNCNFNLGIPQLLPEWKKMFSAQYLGADIAAGITVAFVAIPLSLAIALASGVSPGTGLITAIIAGIVCVLFGGSPLSVSGPAAAMSVLIADVVENFGMEALILMCLIAGIMQLISGIIGLGKLARYVPVPVISGFTAGIGVIILIGQLPRAFGLMPPEESHIFDVLNHIKDYFHEINGTCLLLVVVTLGIIKGLPKVLPKVPPILPAVAFASLMVYFFDLGVPLIGSIPDSLPAPSFPHFPDISITDLFLTSFTIYLLASLETLLSATAIDKLTGSKKHDSNQELMGQGLGNIAVSLFGGIPVTGVIARSATNVDAGAKTRRASIIHSIIIMLTVYLIAPVISLIPIVALAAVLFSVAFSMINYQEFKDLWQTSRSEALIYAITFLTIISVDLLAGVQTGIMVACFIVLWKAVKSTLHISTFSEDDILRFSLSGPLNFLSSGNFAKLEEEIKTTDQSQTVLLDLSSVTDLDSSGAAAIVDLYNHCRDKGLKFYIKGLPQRFESLLKMSGDNASHIEDSFLIFEHEIHQKNGDTSIKSSHGRLLHGVYKFYTERKRDDRRLFQYILNKQDPHTLFISCSDSRIVPTQITSTDPGELFTIRNVGNFVPPYQPNSTYSEAAALEFALINLNITDIIVCGHANCGAIKACHSSSNGVLSAQLNSWINLIKSQLPTDGALKMGQLARLNVLNQLANLKTYPIIIEKLSREELNIYGWYFNFKHSLVYEWDEHIADFKPIVA